MTEPALIVAAAPVTSAIIDKSAMRDQFQRLRGAGPTDAIVI